MQTINTQWTVAAGYITNLLATAEELGASRPLLMRAVGIDEHQLEDPESRLTMSKLLSLFKIAAEQTHTEDFGLHIGRKGTVKSFGLLVYISMCCDTLGDAINILPRYRKLLYDAGDTQLTQEAGLMKVSWNPLSESYVEERYFIDALCSTWVSVSTLICVQPAKPCRMQFSYPEPEDLTLLQETFCDDLSFDHPVTSLFYTPEVCATPMKNADHTMFRHLTEQAEKYFSQLGNTDDLQVKVKEILTRLLPHGEVGIRSVADQLHIGSRTLQRRLNDQDTSFQQLLQKLRAELAIGYLCDKRLRMMEVALLLGYADHSTFTTAFKSWYGLSPREYRQQYLNMA